MVFHPVLPLLAVGTGRYDGGHFFEGELLLVDLEAGTTSSLLDHPLGRLVIGLEWLSGRELRLVMAPYDDWQDPAAWEEGHVAVLRRDDWRAVPAGSVDGRELTGPRGAAPRPDGREQARRVLSDLGAGWNGRRDVRAVEELPDGWNGRRDVRAVEELPDGRIVATLAGIQVECWRPDGECQFAVPDDLGGRDLVVAEDGRSVWVSLVRHDWEDRPQSVVQLSLDDGALLDEVTPAGPVALVRDALGRPVIIPGEQAQRFRFRIRRGRVAYRRDTGHRKKPARLVAAAPVPSTDGRPWEAVEFRRLGRFSWRPRESHYAGPGVEAADGSLVHAGQVWHGDPAHPVEAFVVRREPAGSVRWVFRTDQAVSDVDADLDTVYVALDDGEIVALDLADGTVRWRMRPAVGGAPVFPTVLTAAESGRLLVGTSDGRVLVLRG